MALPLRECKEKNRFSTCVCIALNLEYTFCKEWIKPLCMSIKSFKLSTVLLGRGKEVRKSIFAVVSLYRCFIILLIFLLFYKFFKLKYTQVFVTNHIMRSYTWITSHNCTIWRESILKLFNHSYQKIICNLLFWSLSIQTYWLKLSELLASVFVLGDGEYLYW